MKNYTQLSRHDGNTTLFEVVEMAVISSLWEVPLHIHAEGLRGTGKTTIMRAARQIFPPIERVKGCMFNCDPAKPHCPNHKHLSKEELEKIGSETVPRPFLEISHSAKIGTIAGSIDLAKITNSQQPEAALLPGIIPQAHRGIIFIDEINRLADTSPEITDVLLDVMGTKPGRVQIEETGLPVLDIPVSVSVWAASNPDEEPGPLQEIRRQLSDRFDVVVEMERPRDVESVTSILAQSELHHKLRDKNEAAGSSRGEERLRREISTLAERHKEISMPDFLRNFIAKTYLKYGLESFRAIEAIQHMSLLHSTLRGRIQVLVSDIIKVMPLCLQHRVDADTLTRVMNKLDAPTQSGASTLSQMQSEEDVSRNLENIDIEPAHAAAAANAPSENKGFFGRLFGKGEKDMSPAATPMGEARRLSEMANDELVKGESELID